MLRCAITDRALLPTPSSAQPFDPLVTRCAALAQQGVNFLLIREGDLSAAALTQLSRQILSAVRQANPQTKVLIASRPDIALATGLDGVHLSAHPSELTPAQIRTLHPHADPDISISCHTLAEVRYARGSGVSLIFFAPVFGKFVAGRDVTAAAGLGLLAAACRIAAPTPVLALGGITAENTALCLEAGAAGIAAIRLFMLP